MILIASRLSLACLALAATAANAADCTPPEEGNKPYHRAAVRVKYLPEIETWSLRLAQRGSAVQYVLLLGKTLTSAGRCHWTLEVRAEGRLEHRFYVSPDGESVLAEGASGPIPLAEWRAARKRAQSLGTN
jgi:hypothetical protein